MKHAQRVALLAGYVSPMNTNAGRRFCDRSPASRHTYTEHACAPAPVFSGVRAPLQLNVIDRIYLNRIRVVTFRFACRAEWSI